ncbi:hypothetical protein BJ166DRAFT_540933 [Pestalotiopsis sp. NC0098]|nr:hypothetical protein BJ166DRAFT_540933 [Pestalotiopsis sp. NC0098]
MNFSGLSRRLLTTAISSRCRADAAALSGAETDAAEPESTHESPPCIDNIPHSTYKASDPTETPPDPASEDLLAPNNQSPSLQLLPTELILSVGDILPITDTICLGLACKRFYHALNIRKLVRRGRNLDRRTTRELLYRLEKDVVGMSYCAIEGRLKYIPTGDLHWELYGCHRHVKVSKIGPPLEVRITLDSFWLTWCTAHMVTNHKFLGPQHGILPSALDGTYKHQVQEDGILQIDGWSARLYHGQLLLRCTNEFSHVGGDANSLRTYFSTDRDTCCDHMIIVGEGEHYKDYHLPLATHLTGITDYFDAGSCKECNTDWGTHITWDDTGGMMITITTYRNFGTCRSPEDPEWEAMTVPGGLFRTFRRGDVRKLWKMAR